MTYEYNDIVRQHFEGIKPLFENYLRKNFRISNDEIMYIYTNVWIDVRSNILRGRVRPGTNWTSYILKMGWKQANIMTVRKRRDIDSFDDEHFNRDDFERKYLEEKAAEETIYKDPDLLAVLAEELGSIPETCNKILRLYYENGFRMSEIADMLNYNNADSAKTTKNRCMDKLRSRVLTAVRRLGILD